MDVNFKIWILLGAFLTLMTFSQCNKPNGDGDCETYNYSDCNTLEPFTADMTMSFSYRNSSNYIAFEIYDGTVDKGQVIVYDTAWGSSVTYTMPIPAYYSVSAKYLIDGKTIYTIDGAEMKKKKKSVCDSTCWIAENISLDLMVK